MCKRWICLCLALVLVLLLLPVLPVTVKAAANFTVSQQLLDTIKDEEGFDKYPFWDYNQWTVGYGSRCPDDKLEEYKQNGIPDEDAEDLLKQEINGFQSAVNKFASDYDLSLKQNQFDALVSFSYNCGTGWMKETTGYFHQAVRSGSTGSVFLYGICLFSIAGGEYILTNRRLSEANMYINGVYQASTSSDFKVPDNFKYVFLDAGGATMPYIIYAYDANEGLPVPTNFKTVPVGENKNGGLFAYSFQGWFTADGKKLSTMDKTPANGSVIYARWADPSGKVVELPKGDKVDLQVTVTNSVLNVRSGPATYYSKVGTVSEDQVLQLTQVCEGGGYTWGKFDKGWIALSYTNYDQVVNQTAFPKNATVTGTTVNVRSGPSTGYKIVGTKTQGDRIVIYKEEKGGSYNWGQMADGNWICVDYITYDGDKVPAATAIQVVQNPNKTTYYLGETLDVTGGVVAVCYDDGSVTGVLLTSDMVSGYDAGKLGQQTLKVTYDGFAANFTVNVKQKELPKYTVTFKDWDGTVLQSAQYQQGSVVTPPKNPTRPTTAQYSYTFAGWDKAVVNATANAVYTATYQQIPRTYTVTFLDWDDTVLQQKTYQYQGVVNPPASPNRGATAQYTYQFAGWDKKVVACTEDTVYRATYRETARTYTVTFQNWDGAVLQKESYTYGQEVIPPQDPTRPMSSKYTYEFIGWDKPVVPCAGNAIYVAKYEQIAVEMDFDLSDGVTNTDVIYLLWHTLFPGSYPVNENVDFNKDGAVNNEDVIYLLWHTMFPESYPI